LVRLVNCKATFDQKLLKVYSLTLGVSTSSTMERCPSQVLKLDSDLETRFILDKVYLGLESFKWLR
jgi:hypothetical protein